MTSTHNLNSTTTDSHSDISQISKHSATVGSPVISDDKTKVSKEQKSNDKRPNRTLGPVAKRTRLQTELTASSEAFRTSESFDHPEFLVWLKYNQHLRAIKGSASKICELLDRVRRENPALNEIFLAFANNGKKVNPHFFDIAQLVRPNDSVIFLPTWEDRRDLGATYIWSFDIPIEDLKLYCDEIEKDISDHLHCDTETYDCRTAIVTQFRNCLENELPLDTKIKVFRWLYVGQTTQSPPFKRWRNYYRKIVRRQRTLTYLMVTLTERNVPHHLVVVSSDGSKNMEAIVAALLNIRVDESGRTANAINRAVCGPFHTGGPLKKQEDGHDQTIEQHNRDIDMIICNHCDIEITIRGSSTSLNSHACSASGLKTKRHENKCASLSGRLFTQMYWCPSKDTCKACLSVVPRAVYDISVDLSLEESLRKSMTGKKNRQRFVLSKFDNEKVRLFARTVV